MPKVFTYLLAFVLLTTIGMNVANYTIELKDYNKTPYQQAFSSIGANSLEFRLDCWAKIKRDPNHEYQKQINAISQALGIRFESDKWEKSEDQGLKYKSPINDAQCSIIFRETDEDITYIIMALIFASDQQNIMAYQMNLNKIKNIKWNFCQLYHGYMDILVSQEALEILLEVMSKNMNAEIVEKYLGENYVSATLKHKKSQIDILRNTYDWQIALRRDQDSQKTLIWIGSPFIISDY